MAAAKNIELKFASEEMKNKFEKEFERFTADTALMEKIDAVDTIEEIYEVCKDRVQFSLDEYCEIMKEVEAHIKSNFMDNENEELSDDDLEDVVGGSWSSFWNKVGKVAAIVGIVAGVVALGVVTGGASFAGVAALATGVAGTFGTAAGTSTIIVAATTGAIATAGVAGAAILER